MSFYASPERYLNSSVYKLELLWCSLRQIQGAQPGLTKLAFAFSGTPRWHWWMHMAPRPHFMLLWRIHVSFWKKTFWSYLRKTLLHCMSSVFKYAIKYFCPFILSGLSYCRPRHLLFNKCLGGGILCVTLAQNTLLDCNMELTW